MTIENFLITYGAALILPLSVVEGPVVSVVTGFLTARGYFDWFYACGLLVCGDVIGDLGYYWIGRRGGAPLARLAQYFRLRGDVSPELRRDLTENAGKMLVIGKWTHSIGCVVLIGAGMLRVPLPRFILINLLATLPKSAVLLGVGYFAGENFPLVEDHAILATMVLCMIGLTAVAAILWRSGLIWAGRGAR